MKKLAAYITVCLTAPVFILTVGWILPLFQTPHTDPNLSRLFPMVNEGLIVGTSRSAQGIDPSSLSKECRPLDGLFNFSFNITDSPWSPQYRDAIQWQSQHTTSETPTFIVSVDPWSLLNTAKRPSQFLDVASENKIATTLRYALTTPPLTKISAEKELSKAIVSRVRNLQLRNSGNDSPTLTEEGWLPNDRYRDSAFTQWAIDDRIQFYRNNYPRTQSWPSSIAMTSLKETIQHLKTTFPNGNTILLRMPTTAQMHALELETFPEFDSVIVEISQTSAIPYIDANHFPSEFQFNDAHHLYKTGAQAFSEYLGDTLCSHLNP